MVNTTVEIIKQITQNTNPVLSEGHIAKLDRVLGRGVYQSAERKLFVENARKLGFNIFVEPKSVLRFKYHASLLGETVFRNTITSCDCYRYSGDVPDFALDNIQKVKECRANSLGHLNMTVHSMEYLPVEIKRIPVMVDPVVIWWENSQVCFYKCFRTWKISDLFKNSLGVIVAIWDKDKELKVI